MEYRIAEVKSRKDLKRFISFPDRLYRGCPQYVPALHSDQVNSLTKVSTLSYCKMKMWLAVDGNDSVVGRICGIINPRYNDLYNTSRARFGWFDTINDLDVASLLLGTAESWAEENGMNEIHGPLYYNTLGKQGMLVEGFGNLPPFNCIYNFPYYKTFVEKLGYEKECDWVQYRIDITRGLPEKTVKMAELVKERYQLHTVNIDRMKKNARMVREFFNVYNESFSTSVHNFVPFTREEIDEEMESVMPYVSDKLSCIIMDEEDKVAAFGIVFPSLSKAFRKARGKMFPFGWIHILKALHDYENLDLMLAGAASEWRDKGVSSTFFLEIAEKMHKCGAKWAVTNPQLENNPAVNLWNSYQREPYMRHRCYLKSI